jgi:Putative Flp pilus-assembly TadE/G-like
MRRRRRTSEAGQVVVITALMGTVILGGMALTVDLSLHTFNQRTLQNVADAAALSGATDLQRIPNVAQQQLGVTSALSTIQQNQNFPPGWTGASTATACTIGTLAGLCETVNYLNYTVKISTPPQTAKAPTNVTLNDFEVDMSVNVSNNFGAFVGAATSTVGARAVAYHSGPPSPYSYTFFAATEVDSGNQSESIVGDAYVGSGYVGSSRSNSGLCVSELKAPEPTGDSDSDTSATADSDIDDQGHVTFGSLPPISQNGVPNGDPIYGSSACSNGKIATQTTQSGSPSLPPPNPLANCPAGSAPWPDLNGLQCLQASPTVPTITLPTPNKPALICGDTVSGSTPAGIYPVTNGCTINLSFAAGDINCVDLVLGVGSSVNVVDKSSLDYMTSWDYNTSTDPTALKAINALFLPSRPPNLTATCPGAQAGNTPPTLDTTSTQVDTCIVCAQPSTAPCSPGVNTCPVALTNGSTGCCSDTLFVGAVFLPGQEIMFKSNQSMEDVGQIYCGYWAVSSGNHPNPVVTHDNSATDLLVETLRLVE